jgi:hypothetical protein
VRAHLAQLVNDERRGQRKEVKQLVQRSDNMAHELRKAVAYLVCLSDYARAELILLSNVPVQEHACPIDMYQTSAAQACPFSYQSDACCELAFCAPQAQR